MGLRRPTYLPFPRRMYRHLFVSWARRNKILIGGATAGVIVLIAAETALVTLLMPGNAFRWWLLGVFQTTIVAIAAHLIVTSFLTYEASAIHQLRGAWGEEATRDALATAKRKRLIWGWIDSIDLSGGDIDHVVVTRNGGLVAIDSKWRSDTRDFGDIAHSAVRLRTRAEAVARSLLKQERGGHRAKVNALQVTVAVVVWGAARKELPPDINGVAFVDGTQLRSWLASLAGNPVDHAAAAEVLAKFEDFRATARAGGRGLPKSGQDH